MDRPGYWQDVFDETIRIMKAERHHDPAAVLDAKVLVSRAIDRIDEKDALKSSPLFGGIDGNKTDAPF